MIHSALLALGAAGLAKLFLISLVAGIGITAAGQALRGMIDWPLAAFIAVPQISGVVAGWKIAHSVPTRHLRYALAGILLALAPYLALYGG